MKIFTKNSLQNEMLSSVYDKWRHKILFKIICCHKNSYKTNL